MAIKEYRVKLEDVLDQGSGRWLAIFQHLSSDNSVKKAANKPGALVPCPKCGGTTRFKFFKHANQRGDSLCNSCGFFTNGIYTAMFITGQPFKEVLYQVAEYLGMDTGDQSNSDRKVVAPVKPRVNQVKVKSFALDRLKDAFDKSIPITDPNALPAVKYLRNRGLKTVPASILFHPNAEYWCSNEKKVTGHYPTIMLPIVDTQSGEMLTLHRHFLTWDGHKADVPIQKSMMPMAIDNLMQERSVAIPLFDLNGSVMGIAEGLENAISCCEMTGIPVWPTYSASSLAKFVPPSQITEVHIFGEVDPGDAGQRYAAMAALHLRERGLKVVLRFPVDKSFVIPMYGSYSFNDKGNEVNEETMKLAQVIRDYGYKCAAFPRNERPKDSAKWPDWNDLYRQQQKENVA